MCRVTAAFVIAKEFLAATRARNTIVDSDAFHISVIKVSPGNTCPEKRPCIHRQHHHKTPHFAAGSKQALNACDTLILCTHVLLSSHDNAARFGLQIGQKTATLDVHVKHKTADDDQELALILLRAEGLP